jgi:hypothetical protein
MLTEDTRKAFARHDTLLFERDAARGSVAEFRDRLWIELRHSHRSAYELSRAYGQSRGPVTAARLNRARGYRDGLLTAYAMLTAQTEEDVYEDLQHGLAD